VNKIVGATIIFGSLSGAGLLISLQSIASNQIVWWIFAALWFARVGWAVAGKKTSLRRHLVTASLTVATLFAIALIARETKRRSGPYLPDDSPAPAYRYHVRTNSIQWA
jgi:hypothetical protein